jgi:hypothetical protein
VHGKFQSPHEKGNLLGKEKSGKGAPLTSTLAELDWTLLKTTPKTMNGKRYG